MSEPTILSRIEADLITAMKARDADTLSTLRMLKSAIMEEKTKRAKDAMVSRDEEIEILQRYVRKRRETIEEVQRAGRHDSAAMVEREEREIVVTQRYLPAMMGEEELKPLIREAIAATGASVPKDMGRVMGALMPKVKGRSEPSLVSRLVKQALGG